MVSIEQVVNDIPNGIYPLSRQAFERPAENGSYSGEEDATVFLYMNDSQTPCDEYHQGSAK